MIILTAFGDWLETNAITLIVAIAAMGTNAIILAWKGSQLAAESKSTSTAMADLAEAFDHHREAFQTHVANTDMHVNQLHQRSIEKRIDKMELAIENSVLKFENGVAKINDKLDRMADRMHK
jgi:hypothetical protein